MNKNFIIAGGVVLAIGLAVAIGVTLVDEPLDGNLPEGETTVNGDILPEFASENDDNIARGLAAPTFSAPNENSEIVSLQKNGNAKALIFLAHWCGYCQQEVPVVQEYVDLIVKHLRPTGQNYNYKGAVGKGRLFYELGYGLFLGVLATVKWSFTQRGSLLAALGGFLGAWLSSKPKHVTKQEARFIRQYRWSQFFSLFVS